MTNLRLSELVSLTGLQDELIEGFISARPHPLNVNLKIFNYTHRAAYEGRWNHETMACRGLIVAHDPTGLDGEVVGRPFAKFFNYGEHLTNDLLPPVPLHEPFHVTDKEDGSLGIWYMAPDGPSIATRGSFTSEQALWATQHLREYHGDYRPSPGTTPLFEIIYPANRIVLDYGDRKDLIHLATIDIDSGREVEETEWDGPRTKVYSFDRFEDLLGYVEKEEANNREGFVVTFKDSGLKTKLKFAEYVALHRILTGLSERRIWEHISQGGDIKEFVEAVPDEFYEFVTEVDTRLRDQHFIATTEVSVRAEWYLSQGYETRKDLALALAEEPYRSWVFLAIDGHWSKLDRKIWDSIKPVGNVTFREADE